jgi:hypothetical protein
MSQWTKLLLVGTALAIAVPGAFGGSAQARSSVAPKACTKTWTGGNGRWADGVNWSPQGVPTWADDVCIMTDGTYVVTVDDWDSAVAGTLALGGSSGTQTLELVGSCDFGDARLVLSGAASIGRRGAVLLTSTGCVRPALLDAGSNTITNDGTITAAAGVNGGHRVLTGDLANSGALIVDEPLTSLSGGLTNTGTVEANESLALDGTGATHVNRGSLAIADGAVVSTTREGQTFTNGAGGSIAMSGSGTLRLQLNATFRHGFGSISGPNPIELVDSSLALLSAERGAFLWQGEGSLSGDIRPLQTLTLSGNCEEAHAIANAPASFKNAGLLTLTSTCFPFGAEVSLPAGSTLTNTGTVALDAGAGGNLRIAGHLDNRKTLSLGRGATLDLVGDYSQTSSGTFKTFVGDESSFGKLTSSGSAVLGGTLEIVTDTGFGPQEGQSFQILTAATRAGTFQTVTGRLLPCPHKLGFKVDYGATDVTLTLERALACS